MRAKGAFKRDMQDAFAYFDTDKSGKLDQTELYTSFTGACPFAVSEERFAEIFAQLDADGDGNVTVDEFVDFMMNKFVAKNAHTDG